MKFLDDRGWPALPLAEWRETYATLHMWLQIVGKTRLALAPSENHWWQVALYVTPTGLTTSPMPYGALSFAVEFNFIDHWLSIRCSDGSSGGFALEPRSVADFFQAYISALAALGITFNLHGSPVEVQTATPFARDFAHCHYDPLAAQRSWQILLASDRVLKRFRSRFCGKQSPSHFFWGSFDIALTRFSGNAAPRHAGGVPNCPDRVMVEAYSHQCSSCGFWPGGGVIDAPAFYAYTYPQPPGYERGEVQPPSAYFEAKAGEFILPYDDVRLAADPESVLLQFFQSTYETAANLAGWDRAALDRPVDSWS